LDGIANSPYLVKTFYITGGTALSEFYFHHRYSEDLGFFSQSEIDYRNLEIEISKIIKVTHPKKVEKQTLNGQQIYWFVYTNQTIKIDFAYFPFEPLGEFKKFKNLKISSLEDLAVNKLQAIMTRKRGRDFLDYFYIANETQLTPQRIAQLYRLKFDMTIRPEEIAKHFVGVLDATDQPTFLGREPWKTIEDYFISESNKIKTKIVE
jgi:predicted nucleotidyltransferase component of viral defense system